jgi:hypothetical protein
MQWRQVCQAALAFSASRGATVMQSRPHPNAALTLVPMRSTTEITIEPHSRIAGAWYVRMVPPPGKRQALRPVDPPVVSTPEELTQSLMEAWVTDRCIQADPRQAI